MADIIDIEIQRAVHPQCRYVLYVLARPTQLNCREAVQLQLRTL